MASMSVASASRQKVLQCYKKLLKTRKVVFRDDDFAIRESAAKIRAAFDKNRDMSNPDDIARSIEIAELAEEYLREDVMQARINDEGTVRINVRADNVKQFKTFKLVGDDE